MYNQQITPYVKSERDIHHHFVETNSNNLSLKGKKSFREEILSLHNASSTERIFISSPFSLGLNFSSRANTKTPPFCQMLFWMKHVRQHSQNGDAPRSCPCGCHGSIKQATAMLKDSLHPCLFFFFFFLSTAAAKAFQRNGN